MKVTYVSMANDLSFKYVFSHYDVAQYLVDTVFDAIGLEKEPIVDIEGQSFIPGSNIEEKNFYGDIVVKLKSGRQVSLEMYRDFKKEQFLKSLFYLTRLFSGQLEPQERYIKAKEMISINFIFGDYHGENPNLINKYRLVSENSLLATIDNYVIILLIRLDKVNLENYKNNRLERLGGLLKEEILEEAERIVKGDKMLEQALMYNKEFLENPVLRLAYEDLLKEKTKCRDEGEEKGRAEGEEFGMKKGRVEGLAEGKMETAKNMIAAGEPLSKIEKYTGLSKKKLKSLNKK